MLETLETLETQETFKILVPNDKSLDFYKRIHELMGFNKKEYNKVYRDLKLNRASWKNCEDNERWQALQDAYQVLCLKEVKMKQIRNLSSAVLRNFNKQNRAKNDNPRGVVFTVETDRVTLLKYLEKVNPKFYTVYDGYDSI